MKNFFEKYGFHYLMTCFVTVCVTFLGAWALKLPVSPAPVIIGLAVCAALLAAADARGGWGLALTVPAAVCAAVLLTGREELARWFPLARDGLAPEPEAAGNAAIFAAGVLAALPIQYLVRLTPARWFLSAAWSALWLTQALRGGEVPKCAVIAMIPVLTCSVTEIAAMPGRRGRRQRIENIRPLLALFAAFAMLLSVIPTSEEPYDWTLVKKAWNTAVELWRDVETRILTAKYGNVHFSMDLAGFTEDARLGNGIAGEDGSRQMLQAVVSKKLKGPVYLTGNKWDTLSGDEWTNADIGEDAELLSWDMDAAEHIFALYRLFAEKDEWETDAYVRENNILLRYINLPLRTLFTASDQLLISTDEEEYPYDIYRSGVLFDYLPKDVAWYRLYWLEMNREKVPELIASAMDYKYRPTNTYPIWQRIREVFQHKFLLHTDYHMRLESELDRRQRLIEDTCLTLPESMEPGVADLAHRITAGCENDYEKLLAIEKYLRENYTYTLNPAPAPEGRDAVSHFLLDSREGYCTVFASAAALLARCEGIPSRYVQGFYLEDLTPDEVTAVTSQQAHAWAEGYIPGYGWMTVEPTPGYIGEGQWEETDDGKYKPEGVINNPEDEPEDDLRPIKRDAAAPAEEKKSPVKTAAVAAAVIAALGAAAFLSDRLLFAKRRRYKRLSYTERARADLGTVMKLGARVGYPRGVSEGVAEYFERLTWSLGLNAYLTQPLGKLYEEIVFAGREIDGEEWRSSQWIQRELKHRRRAGRPEK